MKNVMKYMYIVEQLLRKNKRKNEIAKIESPLERKKTAHPDVQEVFNNILKKLEVELEVHGTEHVPKEKPVLFVSNHQGNFDIAVLLAASPVPISFIAKKETKKIPIVNQWMTNIDCLFIDRKKGKESLRLIDEVSKELENRGSFVLFPEGTRSRGKEMNAFKRGGLSMALKNDVTVIPITIDGSYHIMEEMNGKLQKGNVKLTFHPPMNFGIKKKYDDDIKEIQKVIGNAL